MFMQSLKALIESSLTIPISNTCVKSKNQAILNTLSIVSFLSFCGMHCRFLRHAIFFFKCICHKILKTSHFLSPSIPLQQGSKFTMLHGLHQMPTCLSPLISFKSFLMISVLSPPLRKLDNKQKLFMGVERPGGGHSFLMTAFLPFS